MGLPFQSPLSASLPLNSNEEPTLKATPRSQTLHPLEGRQTLLSPSLHITHDHALLSPSVAAHPLPRWSNKKGGKNLLRGRGKAANENLNALDSGCLCESRETENHGETGSSCSQVLESSLISLQRDLYVDGRTPFCSGMVHKPKETIRIFMVAAVGMMVGYLIGASFPLLGTSRLPFPSNIISYIGDKNSTHQSQASTAAQTNETVLNDTGIYVPTNPRGAERLPPGIVVPHSDFYLRRLWGKPSEDLTIRPKYLVTFTVGAAQKQNIDAAVKKFSENFTIVLFHYDGKTSEWEEFEWSKRAIHVSTRKQTKWWFAKRFLHPDIVAEYEYIFIWDEDLGVGHFDGEEYIKLVKKHGLEISQPALDSVESRKGLVWRMTKRRGDREVHKETDEIPGRCADPHLPPCSGFVEIMAPVFSCEAWRCVWHMIQNDLVHGWGIDFALRRCVEPAYEKIGVVDAQYVAHQAVPSLGNQGTANDGKEAWQGVRERCHREWGMFKGRMKSAVLKYYKEIGVTPSNWTLY